MLGQAGFDVLYERLPCLLGWRECGKWVYFLGQLFPTLSGGRLGNSMSNHGEKTFRRAASDEIFARWTAHPEVVQPFFHKYPPPAIQGAGELHSPVLVLCQTLGR